MARYSERFWRLSPLLVALILTVLAAGIAESLVSSTVHRNTIYALALIGAILVIRFPEVLLAYFLLVEQYTQQSELVRQMPLINVVGSEVYNLTRNGVPVLVAISVCAAAGALIRLQHRGQLSRLLGAGTSGPNPVLFAALAIVPIYPLIFLLHNPKLATLSLSAGLVGSVSPTLLLLSGFVVCYEFINRERGEEQLTLALGALLVLKAVVVIYTWLSTGGATVDGQAGVVYYEPTTPLLGVAVLGAWASGNLPNSWRGVFVLLPASLVIVASFRLTIFIAAICVLVLVPLVSKKFQTLKYTGLVVLACVMALAVLPASSILQSIASRIASLGAITGSAGTSGTSASLHVDDVRLGLDLAWEHTFLGLGPNSSQPREFADSASQTLYVHNEYLQQWLLFGIVGLIVTVALFGLIALKGYQVLRNAGKPLSSAAGAVALFAWLPLLSAPFFSTTQRIPLLLGSVLALASTGFQTLHRDEFESAPVDHVSSRVEVKSENNQRHGPRLIGDK